MIARAQPIAFAPLKSILPNPRPLLRQVHE